jgi:thiosulfate dehydrogenase [quinone] large subunit
MIQPGDRKRSWRWKTKPNSVRAEHRLYEHRRALAGAALRGFIEHTALPQAAQGPHSAVTYGWYVAFLRWMDKPGPSDAMAKVIALGETTIGVLLILGLFTGIAAFFAVLLTMSFGLAGVAGVNPVFFFLEVFLILPWRNAGWIGLDHRVLPWVGTL